MTISLFALDGRQHSMVKSWLGQGLKVYALPQQDKPVHRLKSFYPDSPLLYEFLRGEYKSFYWVEVVEREK